MRNSKTIIILTVLVTVLCLYNLSFTFIARNVQKEATEHATNKEGQVDLNKKQKYLESVYNEPVFNLLGLSYTYKEVKERELGLGLDLQGGMHVMLEVSPVEILKALAGPNASTDIQFRQALEAAKEKQRSAQSSFTELFYDSYHDISGGKPLSTIFSNTITREKGIQPNSSDEDIKRMINQEVEESVDRAEKIIRTRIDKFGVVSPNIQRLAGTGRIQLELPGVDNPQRVRNLLQGVAQLEFLPVYFPQEIEPYLKRINDYRLALEKKTPSKGLTADTAKTAAKKGTGLFDDSTQANAAKAKDTTATSKADSLAKAKKDSADAKNQISSFFSLQKGSFMHYEIKDTSKINDILNDPKVKSMLPSNLEFLWEKAPAQPGEGPVTVELIPVKLEKGPNALTGESVVNARYDVDQRRSGNMEVIMVMNDEGARKWKNITREAAQANHRRIAIVLDRIVYSAPQVNEEIPGGVSSITGNFTLEEAKDLSTILEAGKLPAPVRIVEEVVIGPSLGREAILQGLNSMLVGLAIVVVFMILYYNKGGFIADVALLFNVLFILGFMASINAVLTLPGIAGMVLTIGMAVDANVLIFERIREEIANGKPLRVAIDLGFDKAFSSIFDSNVTTIITGAILAWLGTGPVQGFAITLIIGLCCSFFTAVYISKVIILWMTKDKDPKSISFSTFWSRNLFKSFNFDFISKRKAAYIFSTIVLALGVVSIIAQKGLNLGVDFKGGRSYIVQFEKPVIASEIKDEVSKDLQGTGTEVKAYGSNYKMKVTTSYLINDESTEADNKVSSALSNGLSQLKDNKFEILSSTKVGATVADDIIWDSIKAIILSLVGIFVYVLVRFKKWQFSLGGVVALLHDALMVVALFSIFRWFGYALEIDQVFIAAILTIVGFSINDTVIVFDRVREFMAERTKIDLPSTLNGAINDTLSRTIITTFTVLLVVIILLVFGGETLRGFSLAMLIGIISGTYSTIYIAIPMVLDVGNKKEKEAPVAAVASVKK